MGWTGQVKPEAETEKLASWTGMSSIIVKSYSQFVFSGETISLCRKTSMFFFSGCKKFSWQTVQKKERGKKQNLSVNFGSTGVVWQVVGWEKTGFFAWSSWAFHGPGTWSPFKFGNFEILIENVFNIFQNTSKLNACGSGSGTWQHHVDNSNTSKRMTCLLTIGQ